MRPSFRYPYPAASRSSRSRHLWANRYAITMALATCLASPLSAQRLPINNFTVDDGLGSNQVFEVLQDRRGLLWIAGSAGLTRFDGVSFDSLGLADGLSNLTVRAIAEGPEGELWLATGNALARYDGVSVREWDTDHGLRGQPLWDVTLDASGRVWFTTTTGGVGVLDDNTIRQYTSVDGLATDQVYGLLVDSADRLWIGPKEPGQGLSRCTIDKEGQLRDCRTFGEESGLASDPIRALIEDEDGNVWIGTRGHGLFRYDGSTFQQYSVANTRLAGDDVYALWITRANELAVGSLGGGVSLCPLPSPDDCRTIRQSNGLTTNLVLGVYEDAERSLWVATFGAGIDQITSELYRHRGEAEGLPSPVVLGLQRDGAGDLWVGTLAGLTRIRNPDGRLGEDDVQTWSVDEGLPSNQVWDLLLDRHGRLWVGTRQGLCLFDEEDGCRVFSSADGMSHDYVAKLFESDRGDIWVGSLNGVSRLTLPLDQTDPEIVTFTAREGLSGNEIHSITQDIRGRIWIGSLDGGLDVINGDQIQSFGEADGLPTDGVTALHTDPRGWTWIGTLGGGLVGFDPRREPYDFQTYGVESGLGTTTVLAIADGADGLLWLGTKGVDLFDPNGNGGRGRVLRRLDRSTGLVSNEIPSASGLLVDDRGRLWLGLNRGLTEFRADLESPQDPPTTIIAAISSGGIRRYQSPFSLPFAEAGEVSGTEPRRVSIPPRDRTLRFDYRGLTFVSRAATRYQIQLEGFDSSWSKPTKEVFKEYTNLDPGTYRFLVRSRKSASEWGKPARIEVRVESTFWQTPLFSGLSILGAFLVVVAGHRARTRHVEARNRELQRVVTERTEELRRHAYALERNVEELDRAKADLQSTNEDLEHTTGELQRSNQELDQFAFIVSHDLKAPLVAIAHLTKFLEEDLGPKIKDESAHHLRLMRSRAERLAAMIDGLLAFARISWEDPEPTEVDLHQLLSEVVDTLAPHPAFRVHWDPGLPTLTTQRLLLHQVFSNLLSNAIKHHPRDDGKVEITTRDLGDELEFSVRDDGPGIPEECRERVFEIFSTLQARDRKESTGVGLAIVRKVVTQVGGRTWVESRRDEGADFRFTWPKVTTTRARRRKTSTASSKLR